MTLWFSLPPLYTPLELITAENSYFPLYWTAKNCFVLTNKIFPCPLKNTGESYTLIKSTVLVLKFLIMLSLWMIRMEVVAASHQYFRPTVCSAQVITCEDSVFQPNCYQFWIARSNLLRLMTTFWMVLLKVAGNGIKRKNLNSTFLLFFEIK
jgi:hypothetical protein